MCDDLIYVYVVTLMATPITSHIYLFMRPFKLYSLSKFKLYNSVINYSLYCVINQISDFIHLITESLYLILPTSPYFSCPQLCGLSTRYKACILLALGNLLFFMFLGFYLDLLDHSYRFCYSQFLYA